MGWGRERKETAPPDESCVFCGIVSGEGPAFVVYEDVGDAHPKRQQRY